MSFIVIVFTCFVGIYGQSCKPWQEHSTPRYATYQECERQVRQMTEEINESDPHSWGIQLPKGKWRLQVKGFCMIPVIDEVVVG